MAYVLIAGLIVLLVWNHLLSKEIKLRKHIEARLLESEFRYASLAQVVPVGIFRTDAQQQNTYVNDQCCEILGLSPEVAAREGWIKSLHPDDRELVIAEWGQAIQENRPFQLEYRFKRPDEKVTWVYGQCLAERDAQGNLLGYVGSLTNISDRKRAEELLRESEQRFRRAVEDAPFPIMIHAEDGEVLQINNTWTELTGYTHQDIPTTQIWTERAYGEHAAKVLKEVIAKKYSLKSRWKEGEFTITTSDGSQRIWEFNSAPLGTLQDERRVVISMAADVTERRQAENALGESEERFRSIYEQAAVGLANVTLDGKFLKLNPRFCEMLGYPQEELLTKTVSEITHPDDRARILPAMQSIISGEVPYFFQEKRYLRRDGSCFWSSTSVSLVRDCSSNIKHALAVIRDISERKQAEAALKESEQRFRNMAANVPGAIFQYVLHPDGSDSVIYMSPGCYDLWEVEAEAVVKDTQILWELVHPDDQPTMYESVRHSARTLQPWSWRWRITTPSGKIKWLEASGCPERHENGDIVWDTLIMDISDRIKAEHKLKHDALHDSLTGLPNRNLLMERLDLAFKRAQRHPEYHFALLFLDLDNFKAVNDSMGHLIGDELLLAVVTRLDKCIRETDLVARLGGDEFVILLEELNDIEESVRIAERILESLQLPFHLSSRELFTSTSVGIAVGSTSYERTEDLLRDADLAMYRAKKNGRGQYAIFDPTMHFQVVQRLDLEHDLRKALVSNEFTIYYQPIFEIKTMVIKGFEALIRWQHPRRGFISPGEFIEIAEETGLIMPMGHWILHTACQQLAAWQAQFPTNPLQMSVNLSVKQMQSSLLPELEEVLTTYNLQENSLGLEITESMWVENVEVTLKLLNQIKAKGIYLSIDDFGTGYSSLRYLTQLPVDTLKIDRAFVSQATTDTRNQIIAESVIALSNLLDLKAIAEGIETEQQLEWLKGHGCELGQGFLFSPPLPAELATEMLKKAVQFVS